MKEYTKKYRLLMDLLTGLEITPSFARKRYKTASLRDLIYLLRLEGHNIKTRWVKPKQGFRYPVYFISKTDEDDSCVVLT